MLLAVAGYGSLAARLEQQVEEQGQHPLVRFGLVAAEKLRAQLGVLAHPAGT